MEEADLSECRTTDHARRLYTRYETRLENAQENIMRTRRHYEEAQRRLQTAERDLNNYLAEAAHAIACLTQCTILMTQLPEAPTTLSPQRRIVLLEGSESLLLPLRQTYSGECVDFNSSICSKSRNECLYVHQCRVCHDINHGAVSCPSVDENTRCFYKSQQTYCRKFNFKRCSVNPCDKIHRCILCNSRYHAAHTCR